MSKAPNILLVVLDSVRAKNCSLLGHDNETTPFLSEFAQDATCFTQARSPSIQSIASHASIFTGLHAEEHGLVRHVSQLDPEATIWHELEQNYGYNTGLFTPNVLVTETSNFAASFTKVSGPKRRTLTKRFEEGLAPSELEGSTGYATYLRESLAHPHPIRSLANGFEIKLSQWYIKRFGEGSHDPKKEHADVYVNELVRWIEHQSGPWAACLNLMDAHTPYVPDPEYDQWGGESLANLRDDLPDKAYSEIFLRGHPWGDLKALEPLYDGCIRQVDAGVQRLISELEEMEVLDDTLLVVTSDHGEGFGERSTITPTVRHVSHNWGIGEELLHVPLLVKAPGQQTGRRVSSVASLTKFPQAVRMALQNSDPADAFVPDDGIVVSSTDRIIPPGEKYPLSEAELRPYFGPWRAMYRHEDEDLVKYSEHRGDEQRERIINAQVSFPLASIDDDSLSTVFNGFDDADIELNGQGDCSVDDDVTERLSELGYIE